MVIKLKRKKYWNKKTIAWQKFKSPCLVMMCGLPGSGKSTYAKELEEKYGYTIHSSDNLRKELYGDENNQENNSELFNELNRRIVSDLRDGKCVVYDATNINRKRRIAFLKQLENINCRKYCVFIPTSYKDCLKNNKKRDRAVPEEVIKKMYKSFQVPYYNEGFDSVFIDYSVLRKDLDIHKVIKSLARIKQDNPHHKLTIGEHCRKATQYVKDNGGDKNLRWAAYMHDIGKAFCKQFEDAKGNKTEIAHYYGHENVSAYLSIGYLRPHFSSTEDILNIAYLINNHMRLMQLEQTKEENKVKAQARFQERLGDEIVSQLVMLKEADDYASE